MTLLGLDINGTRIRAVQAAAADFPLPLSLDPPAADLPLILSLENGAPEVGLAGLRLCRRQPHLACHGFLPHLGNVGDAHRRFWSGGRHRVDANDAMTAVWKRLEGVCRKSGGVVLGLPGYLNHAQAMLIRSLGAQHRLPIAGSLPSPLAAALAGFAEQAWTKEVLVIDIDDHAMSLVVIRAIDGQAHVQEARHLPHLGLKVWRNRIINSLADLCVLQSRRDPRGSPQAEQGLFDQLESLLDSCQKRSVIQLGVQSASWYQNLVLQPEQIVAFCAGLTLQALYELEDVWTRMRGDERERKTVFPSTSRSEGATAVCLATHAVSRLPGFAQALKTFLETRCDGPKEPTDTEDFGDGLLSEMRTETAGIVMLGPDAPARALHGLGAFFQRGKTPGAHLELVAPLPRPAAAEAGPARLHFQGHDFLLGEHNFLGCRDGWQLAVHDARHAPAGTSHCEIVFDHRSYILFNRSHDATLLNDFPVESSAVLRPGDWIRLGFDGPLVRFLGQANSKRAPLTA